MRLAVGLLQQLRHPENCSCGTERLVGPALANAARLLLLLMLLLMLLLQTGRRNLTHEPAR